MKKIMVVLVCTSCLLAAGSVYANSIPTKQSEQASVETIAQLQMKIAREKRLVIYYGDLMKDCLRKQAAAKTDDEKKRYKQAYEVNAAFQQDSYDLIDIFQKRLDALKAQK